MAKYHKNFIFTISLLLSYLSLSISYYDHHNKCSFPKECGKAKTNGMFVFGSSLVDNGNNNFFENRAKADYLPYGMDFPNGPSGRFTNGKNIIDLLGEHLKLPIDFIPSFKDPSTKGLKIVYGVNHASASSGILDDTGIIAGNVTSLRQQIKDFEEESLPELENVLGCTTNDSLPNYLFVVGVGGNDIVFNYFLRKTYLTMDPQTFTKNLTVVLAQYIQKLYSLGGRKFVLTGVFPLGNYPLVKLNMPNCDFCVTLLNQAAQLFNTNLASMVAQLRTLMPGSHFVIINTYNILNQILSDPAPEGFINTTNSCCQVLSRLQGGINGVVCERGGETCEDRNKYVYFDALHPTEAVNVLIANQAYASQNKLMVFPINVQQLSQF